MKRWFLPLILCSFAAHAEVIVFRSGFVLPRAERSRRSMFHRDPVEEAIVKGEWSPPTVPGPGPGGAAWKPAVADTNGLFTNAELEGGWLDCQINSDRDQIRLLRAAGQEVVYVNGEPRPGDPYSNGILEFPVRLHEGANDFLFQVNRGRLSAKLTDSPKPVLLDLGDVTIPDILHGQTEPQWGAVVIVNCTTNALQRLSLRAALQGGGAMDNPLPSIPPLSSRKVPFRFKPHWTDRTNRLELKLTLRTPEGNAIDNAALAPSLKREDEHYNQTFVSDIDGSVQYFAVAPAKPFPGEKAGALVLSTHGASVEASNQAGAYQSKSWATVVAPTNRRPYGFDWEDWGQLDALEVLNLAMARFNIDPRQVYLTGHSMGGHGAWHLGVTYPDRFAAVAPSAGWISFWSYGGVERSTNADGVERMLQRASDPGDTLGLVSNCLHFGVYILHGAEDDNVPVTEARAMRDRLSQFHHDFMYHEQPGAGHWWGNQCVDWPPLFDFLARHRLPADDAVDNINFTTMNPGDSATSHWVTIWSQQHPLEKSFVDAHYDPIRRAIDAATTNVFRLALHVSKIAPDGVALVTLDGQTLGTTHGALAWFVRDESGHWTASDPPPPDAKSPDRYGPFKNAFGHRMILVYATHGSSEENAWAAAKARFDAETWWYRANGSVDVIPDRDFDASKDRDRGVVLYGNADNNTAWRALLADSPVQVHHGQVQIGSHQYQGDDLACLFCRPRWGSKRASIVVISGSGLVGERLTTRAPYFIAGIEYPDVTLYGPETLASGSAGVRTVGFFAPDWLVENGDFVWR